MKKNLIALLLLSACAVGPDYVKPDVTTPDTFKETMNWTKAAPQDEAIRPKWWEVFCDPKLNELEDQVNISNQNIKVAEAQYRQARAVVDEARAAYFPLVSASVSGGRSSGVTHTTVGTTTASSVSNISNSYGASLDASWELDLWGKVRRTVESNEASAQASAADVQSARLSAQAELATDYLELRISDEQQKLLDDTVKVYEKSLQLTKNQYAVGVAAQSDVMLAQTQLDTTKAQAIDVGVLRAQYEHAIAILIGKAPADFSIEAINVVPDLPEIPVAVPSQILQRRPDIAAAERNVDAVNAQIVVAEAAFYPDLTLSASGGFQSSTLSNWFTVPNRVWSVGPSLAETLFDAGLRSAQVRGATAVYDQQVATYRQTVLSAFQEVEDNLSNLRILENESAAQKEAVKSAQTSVTIATNQYKSGIVSYLNVITAQATALSNENTQLNILSRQFTSSVTLIKALGGGWDITKIDAPETTGETK